MANIIVVDDSPIVRAVVVAALSEVGHDVVEAEDGAQFLELSLEEDFDVVLLDILMPVVNGVEALREFRARGGTTEVVLMTSRIEALVSDVFDEQELGGHLIKPLTSGDVNAAVDAVLDSVDPRRPSHRPVSFY